MKEETKDEIYLKVEDKFEEIFNELANEHDLNSGDITPLQNEGLKTLKAETKGLVEEWFKQNKEEK